MTPTMTSHGWHTADDLAAIIGVTPRTIQRWARNRTIPHVRIGRIIQSTEIGEAELTLWLGHRSIQTTLDRYGDLFARRKTRLARQASLAIARGEL